MSLEIIGGNTRQRNLHFAVHYLIDEVKKGRCKGSPVSDSNCIALIRVRSTGNNRKVHRQLLRKISMANSSKIAVVSANLHDPSTCVGKSLWYVNSAFYQLLVGGMPASALSSSTW
jgi:hypothetical protein